LYDTFPHFAGNLHKNGVIKEEINDTIEKTSWYIQDDMPFVDCKMEPDSGDNVANSPDVKMN